METLLVSYILPIIGIVFLVICFLTYLFPFGERFKGKIQKISVLGVTVEATVFTMFIIIGFTFSCLGIFLQVKNYETQIQKVKTRLDEAEKKYIVVLVSLQDVNESNIPDLGSLRGSYWPQSSDNPVVVDISKGYERGTYKIHLRDITRSTYIRKLTLEEGIPNGRKWIKEHFAPFEPDYNLKKEN